MSQWVFLALTKMTWRALVLKMVILSTRSCRNRLWRPQTTIRDQGGFWIHISISLAAGDWKGGLSPPSIGSPPPSTSPDLYQTPPIIPITCLYLRCRPWLLRRSSRDRSNHRQAFLPANREADRALSCPDNLSLPYPRRYHAPYLWADNAIILPSTYRCPITGRHPVRYLESHLLGWSYCCCGPRKPHQADSVGLFIRSVPVADSPRTPSSKSTYRCAAALSGLIRLSANHFLLVELYTALTRSDSDIQLFNLTNTLNDNDPLKRYLSLLSALAQSTLLLSQTHRPTLQRAKFMKQTLSMISKRRQ